MFKLFCRLNPTDQMHNKKYGNFVQSVIHPTGLDLRIYSLIDGILCIVNHILGDQFDLRYCYFLQLPSQQIARFSFLGQTTFQRFTLHQTEKYCHVLFLDPVMHNPSKLFFFDFSELNNLKICVYNRSAAFPNQQTPTFFDVMQRLQLCTIRPYNYVTSPLVDIFLSPINKLMDKLGNLCHRIIVKTYILSTWESHNNAFKRKLFNTTQLIVHNRCF